ncbi:hypothetical protein [Nicoliella lavandulae]|uniref:Uncharacterized protein n=1 Tax=Nicoliella lavandulae TaxID=3082954 RepID=A0ABU8SJ00_9LACO
MDDLKTFQAKWRAANPKYADELRAMDIDQQVDQLLQMINQFKA